MLLTISTTHKPATDLGFLLHKNPDKVHSFELSFGRAQVIYPEATDGRCTAALVLDIDPIGLVRGRRGPAGEGYALEQYVNDRPYVASSFMSVALGNVFSTALSGRCKHRQELADQPIPFEVVIPTLPCRGGSDVLHSLFEPLGYEVIARQIPLDDKFAEWGASAYHHVTLRGRQPLKALLSHLYVLMPVLDNDKHYYVNHDEAEKLLRHGEGWLKDHPERERIVERYLKRQRKLVRETLARLTATEDAEDPDETLQRHEQEEEIVERKLSLNVIRLNAVTEELLQSGAQRVLDLGCGEGRLIRELMPHKQFVEIVGLDVSYSVLEKAQERLRLDRLAPKQRERIKLLHGSLMYRDRRLEGYDAAAVVEVIEHLDPPRLAAFERTLFEFARPGTIVITTPNSEYNVKFESLPAGNFRHKDHRFEWTRAEFESWAGGVAARHGYTVRFAPIGPTDEGVGGPTQMGVFSRGD